MTPRAQPSLRPLSLLLLTLAALALGAWYRFPALDARPMHTDEAILAMKFADFQTSGCFQYDPKDFHGPGLHHLAQAWSKIAGWDDSAPWSAAHLRTVPAVCGLLLLLTTLLLHDALGRRGTALAMLLISVSPMMVYYSRYFIMEVPLVLLITLSIAALWRYSQGGSRWWLIVAGAALGMQHATKETFVINVVAALFSLAATKLMSGSFSPQKSHFKVALPRGHASRPWLWMVVTAVLTSVTLYSSYFQNWQAVKDSALTYLNYLERSAGSGHEKPWHYYLTLIFWRKDGLAWSEALIGGLGLVGMMHAFFGNHLKNPSRQAFLKFLSIYTVVLFGIYSSLAYKTPWSILSGQHALSLLAGVGAAAISAALQGTIARTAFKIGLGLGLYHLIAQTSMAIHLYAADSRNPYVYSHTSSNLLRLLPQVRALQKIAPDDAFDILVVHRDSGWPLPWYWHDIKTARYTTTVPETIEARVIIAELDMVTAIESKLSEQLYTMLGPFGLRPGVMLNMWVEQSLWERLILRQQQEATAP